MRNNTHRYLLVLFILFFAVQGRAGVLSEHAKVMLLTCGPEHPLYASFGHSALWVVDTASRTDKVYNFGTFDPGIPRFYLRFLKGDLQYALSVSAYPSFVAEYREEGRWIKGQNLLLTQGQKEELYAALEHAATPGNRYYRYKFFTDNCSTRILKLISGTLDSKAIRDSLNLPSGTTYRKALRHYLAGRPWLMFGINLLLGPFADKEITRGELTFLPDFLMQQTEHTGIASAPALLLKGTVFSGGFREMTSPMVVLWLIMFLMVAELFWLKVNKRFSNAVDLFVFAVSGFLGVLYLILWFWSDHLALRYNLNIIWANPALLVLLWSIPAGKTKFNRIFLLLYALLLFFLLINWKTLPQSLPMETMPLVTILVFRAVNRAFQFRRMERIIQQKTAQEEEI